MTMEIVGYSERGLLNSLLYEMRYSQNNLQLFNDFLSLISLPYIPIHFNIKDVTILIEQSLSDFGDADSILLIQNGESKQSVFIEAKVKTFQRRSWAIEEQFRIFKEGITQNNVSSSNLFVQLYYKMRLIKALQNGGIPLLKEGISFHKGLLPKSKTVRKIGNNKVVLKAVELIQQYCNDSFFIALVPDEISNVRTFYRAVLEKFTPIGFHEWDVRNWGFVTWMQVEDFCQEHGLKETQKVFQFNKGQIHGG